MTPCRGHAGPVTPCTGHAEPVTPCMGPVHKTKDAGNINNMIVNSLIHSILWTLLP